MRKYLIKITAALMFIVIAAGFCTGCSKQNEAAKNKAAEQLNKGFECTAAVSWNGGNYEVKIIRPSPGLCTMTFLKPDELSSLGFELGEQGLKVKFGSIEASVDPSSLPQSALFSALLAALDAGARPADVAISGRGDEICLSGSTQAGKFTLMLNKNLTPSAVEFPDINLKVNFKEFKFS